MPVARLLLLSLSPFIIGCTESGPVEVEGTVNFQGQPVQSGRIVFVAIEENTSPTSSGTITGGTYKITARGGVQPGKYRVQILIYEPVEAGQGVALDQMRPPQQIGPPEYAGEASPLTADVVTDQTVYDFEVP